MTMEDGRSKSLGKWQKNIALVLFLLGESMAFAGFHTMYWVTSLGTSYSLWGDACVDRGGMCVFIRPEGIRQDLTEDARFVAFTAEVLYVLAGCVLIFSTCRRRLHPMDSVSTVRVFGLPVFEILTTFAGLQTLLTVLIVYVMVSRTQPSSVDASWWISFLAASYTFASVGCIRYIRAWE